MPTLRAMIEYLRTRIQCIAQHWRGKREQLHCRRKANHAIDKRKHHYAQHKPEWLKQEILNYLNSGDTVAGGNTYPTGPISLADRAIIKSTVSQLRDWYVQAGAGGMTATDTRNRGAFMLGGSGAEFNHVANDSNYEIQPERRIAA